MFFCPLGRSSAGGRCGSCWRTIFGGCFLRGLLVAPPGLRLSLKWHCLSLMGFSWGVLTCAPVLELLFLDMVY